MNSTQKRSIGYAIGLHCLATALWALSAGCSSSDDTVDSGIVLDAAVDVSSGDAGLDVSSSDAGPDVRDAARDTAVDACGETTSDPANCGACGRACAPGDACVQSTCVPACLGTMTSCAGDCVNIKVDPANCGACGNTCPGGQVCSAGTCSAVCGQQLAVCTFDGGAPLCLDVQTDNANCGACNHACGVGQVCSGSSCRMTCQPSESECTPTMGIPYCTDTTTDNANCGACAHGCGAGQVCNAGTCGLTCQTGLINCNGTCVDPSTSRAFCGATGACQSSSAGTACPAGQICNAGSCTVSCPGSEVNCNGICIDPGTSNQYCGASADCQTTHTGAACAAGQVCSGGACGLTCQAGLVDCNGKCIDPSTSNLYCGATAACQGTNAGTACAAGQVCSGGTCGLTCQVGLVECNGTCVDATSSRLFCGTSGSCSGVNAGTVCSSGQVCSGGACSVSCPGSQINCNGACVDPLTSNQFCGASNSCSGANSGTTCPTGTVCSAGVCGLSCQSGESITNSHCCPNGQFYCNFKCIDPTVSSQFCGIHSDCAGGLMCGQGQVCSGAVCAATCAPPLVLNGGSCVDPTSITTCGATTISLGSNCGNVGQICTTTSGVSACTCPTGESATNGRCCPTGQFYCDPFLCVGFDPNDSPDATMFACSPPVPRCINPKIDTQSCGIDSMCNNGVTCGQGSVCSLGSCAATCAAPLVLNAGSCVDPTDIMTCGATPVTTGTNCTTTGKICTTTGSVSACACPMGESSSTDGITTLCCPTGQIDCSGACTNTGNDPAHCGSCTGINSVCSGGTVCSGGFCGVSCPGTQVNCGGSCVAPVTDPVHCGAKGNCTTTDVNNNPGATCAGGATCQVGVCTCPTGESTSSSGPSTLCCPDGQTNCGGACTNTDNDPAHCGSCSGGSNLCLDGTVCSGGVCGVSCPGSQVNCGGSCVAPATDPVHCGALGNCTTTDVNNNPGTPCAGGKTCQGGGCACPTGESPSTDGPSTLCCPDGQTNCGGVCTNTVNDPLHCGSCSGASHVCMGGTVCSSSACGVSCPGTQVNCGGSCIAPATDPNHCGARGDCTTVDADNAPGTACTGGAVCQLGGCTCPTGELPSTSGVTTLCCLSGQTNCGGVCVDESIDPTHCGACGIACEMQPNSTSVCAAGSCANVCNSGFRDCNGLSVDGCESHSSNDALNCGACGASCPAPPNTNGGACSSGACAGYTSCTAPFLDCDSNTANGCEVDGSTDLTHCGTCGTSCDTPPNTTGPTCAAGNCGYTACTGTFHDCDGVVSNGCESDSQSDPLNCSTCGHDCGGIPGTFGCINGSCM